MWEGATEVRGRLRGDARLDRNNVNAVKTGATIWMNTSNVLVLYFYAFLTHCLPTSLSACLPAYRYTWQICKLPSSKSWTVQRAERVADIHDKPNKDSGKDPKWSCESLVPHGNSNGQNSDRIHMKFRGQFKTCWSCYLGHLQVIWNHHRQIDLACPHRISVGGVKHAGKLFSNPCPIHWVPTHCLCRSRNHVWTSHPKLRVIFQTNALPMHRLVLNAQDIILAEINSTPNTNQITQQLFEWPESDVCKTDRK